ncbi:MAG: 2Fe-2S iron-sulfur cluster-binding protein [Steroidobacteraceae bacterium]
MRISLSTSHRSFSAAPDRPVLEAALDAGINLPHSCKGGNCGACLARLLQGEVGYPNGKPLGLSESQAAEGLILLCQAYAHTDLALETFEITAADLALVKRLPCRIESAQRLSHDVMSLHLRLPAAERFDFQPGQYIDILLSGGRRRSFSIASPPHDSRLLELHVRRAPGGEFTERLFAGEISNMLLSIEGPLGHFVYRPPTRLPSGEDAPMLLAGGGTGLAPLMSMLRHVIENGLRREMWLYWGVRHERDLYAHGALVELTRRHPYLRYLPVLSEPSPQWQGRRGMVHQAVLEDIEQLDCYDVYASGPPAMIEAVRNEFGSRGVASERLRFDSFDYAPDSPARQRTMASTKS